MFCGNCGKPIPEGQQQCPFCNPAPQEPVLSVPKFERAPMDLNTLAKKAEPTPPAQAPTFQPPVQAPAYEAPAAPAYQAPAYEAPAAPAYQASAYEAPQQAPSFQPPVQQAPAYEAPASYSTASQSAAPQAPAASAPFTLNTPAESKKPKGKGGKIALIVLALLLVAGIVLAVVFWGNITRFFNRTFGDPAVYMQDVEKENVASVAEDVAVAYDEALAIASSNGISMDTSITLEVNDTILSLLSTAMAQNGMDMDLSWVDNIVLTPKVDVYDDTLCVEAGIGLNKVTVATVSVIWDTASQTIYIGIPELHDTYVQIDAAELLGEEVNNIPEALAMSRTIMEAFVDAMPEGAQVEELINRYMGIIIEGIAEAEKENKSVKVGSLKQDLLVVSAELSQKDILNIAANVLETAADDELVEEILNNFDDCISALGGESLDTYAMFSEAIDMASEELEYMIDDAESSTFLTIDTYFDQKDDVVGRTLTVEEENEEISIYYITVTEGEKWEFEAEFGTVSITGEGTVKKDVRNGSYTVSMEGIDYFTLELEDCISNDEQFTGTFRLIPESAIYEAADLDSSAASMLNQAALAITLGTDSITLGIETGGTQLLALVISGEISEPSPISLPDGVDVNDEEGGMKWIAGLNFDAVLGNLESAGVPSEYMDMAKQVVEMFRAEFN